MILRCFVSNYLLPNQSHRVHSAPSFLFLTYCNDVPEFLNPFKIFLAFGFIWHFLSVDMAALAYCKLVHLLVPFFIAVNVLVSYLWGF